MVNLNPGQSCASAGTVSEQSSEESVENVYTLDYLDQDALFEDITSNEILYFDGENRTLNNTTSIYEETVSSDDLTDSGATTQQSQTCNASVCSIRMGSVSNESDFEPTTVCESNLSQGFQPIGNEVNIVEENSEIDNFSINPTNPNTLNHQVVTPSYNANDESTSTVTNEDVINKIIIERIMKHCSGPLQHDLLNGNIDVTKKYTTHPLQVLGLIVHEAKEKTRAKDILPLPLSKTFKRTNRKKRLRHEIISSDEYYEEETKMKKLKEDMANVKLEAKKNRETLQAERNTLKTKLLDARYQKQKEAQQLNLLKQEKKNYQKNSEMYKDCLTKIGESEEKLNTFATEVKKITNSIKYLSKKQKFEAEIQATETQENLSAKEDSQSEESDA